MKRAAAVAGLLMLNACGGSKPPPPSAPATDDAPAAHAADAGADPPSIAEHAMKAMRPDFRRCYQDALARDANVEGKAQLTIKIDPKGDVVTVSAEESTLPAPLTDCLAERVRRQKFGAWASGSLLRIPVRFTKKEPN